MVANMDKTEWETNLDARVEASNELFLVDEALIDLTVLYPNLMHFEQPQVQKAIKYLRGKRDQLKTKIVRLEA